MTLYKTLLFFHILTMAVWVGGNILLAFIWGRVAATRDAQLKVRFDRVAGIAGTVLAASAIVVLGTGIGMVLESEAVELSQTWVWLGLALFGVSLIIGVAYYAPQSSKILAALEAGDSESADRRTKRFDIMVRLDMLVLIAIMAVMVFKPGAPA